jgi:hypothetical protein
MNRWVSFLCAFGPALGYLAVCEAMYSLWEAGAASASAPTFPQIIGGMVGALLVSPGNSLGSFHLTQYAMNVMGYASEPQFGHVWRWFTFHVPMFLVAAAMVVPGLLVAIAFSVLSRRKRAVA